LIRGGFLEISLEISDFPPTFISLFIHFMAAKNAVINYFQQSVQELKKVTWPTRNQSIRLTLIVLGFCVVAAVVLGVVDLGFNQGYRFLVDTGTKLTPPALIDATQTSVTSESSPKEQTDSAAKEEKAASPSAPDDTNPSKP
jgi:preprotein translocase SecE subunit